MTTPQKKLPNILICGTPGCGKTQHCERLKEKLNFKFYNVSEVVKANKFYERFDEEFDTYIIDEDPLLDYLEGPIAEGGCVIDHHTCDFFPERFFQLVVVLRCDNTPLYDRLKARGYSAKKLEENVTAEIMEVVQSMAEESYQEDVVVTLQSDTQEQLEDNCEKILQWITAYMTAEEGGDDDEDAE